MKHAVTKSRKRKKQRIVDVFGGKCQLCGYNKSLNALSFHHTNESIKETAPSFIVASWAENRAIQQLIKEKTILLCLNCHAESHEEKYDLTNTRKKPELLTCTVCRKKFWSAPSREKKCCSVSCSYIVSRKVKDRPSREQLQLLLSEHSFVFISKIYGVSDKTIRKWAKKYDLL